MAAKPPTRAKPRPPAEVTAVLKRLRRLSKLVETKPGDTKRLVHALENVDLASELALSNCRTYTTKKGQTKVKHEPLLQSYLKAQEQGAKLLQLVGPDAILHVNLPSPEELAEAKRVLQARGWRHMPVETEGEPHGE